VALVATMRTSTRPSRGDDMSEPLAPAPHTGGELVDV
jgi:hypothetical protein